jgi:voltage-gated potassium channel
MNRRLMRNKYIWSGIILVAIIIIGTVGYWLIGGGKFPFFDCLYMTFITIATIGFSEVIDIAGNVGARVFTMVIAVAGIGVLAYVVTNVTAAIVGGELTKSFRRRRMERLAMKSKEHYIICGVGRTSLHIINELRATRRPHVVIEIDRDTIEKSLEDLPGEIFIEGDATDNDTLLKAGIDKASGIFAITGDDNLNLVIALTSRQLNPEVRVVAQCNDIKNTDKISRAGAHAVVSPGYISGMRLVSEMVRPTVVNFLDQMLRGKDENLRVEELALPPSLVGKTLSSLDWRRYPGTLLMAVRRGKDWVYNPSRQDYIIQPEDRLIVMTTPEERENLRKNIEEKG